MIGKSEFNIEPNKTQTLDKSLLQANQRRRSHSTENYRHQQLATLKLSLSLTLFVYLFPEIC